MVNINIDEAALCNMRAEQGQKSPQEDLWHAIEQDPELTLNPSAIVADDGGAVDLETFRTDLHRMVEKIYAEP